MVESPKSDVTDSTLKTTECPATDVTQDTKTVKCPEITDTTEEILLLSYEKKLEIYKTDAQTLYEFALLKGLSSKQIKSCLSPILGDQESMSKRIVTGSSRHMIIMSVIVALVAALYHIPFCNELAQVHLKLLSLKTLQFYDWTPLYSEDCFFYNPFLDSSAKNFTEQDCDACLELTDTGAIDRIENANVQKLTDNYLNADVPFVVTDAIRNWKKDADGELFFSLDKLNETLQENPILTTATEDCEFFTTIDGQTNISEFVTAMATADFPDKFHVSWENCDVNAAKIFRLLAIRPYFIPPMAEASKHNQIVISKGNFEGDDFTLPQQIDSASWLVVLEGEMKITLRPDNQCASFGCTPETLYIGKGEAVVVPTRIWELNYSPLSESYTLAFASTLLWDEVV